MRAALFSCLIFYCFTASAQKKFTWEINFSTGVAFNTSPQFKIEKQQTATYSGGGYILPDSTLANNWRVVRWETDKEKLNKLNYKSKITGAFSFGATLNIPLSHKWHLRAGSLLSYTRLTRIAQNESVKYSSGFVRGFSNSPSDSLFLGNNNNPVFIGTVFSLNNLATKTETFNFTTLNFPLTVCRQFKKIHLETGLTTAFIINAVKENAKITADSEIRFEEPAFNNSTTVALALTFCPSYQLTDKINLGIAYNHGLSSLISSDNHRNILQRTAAVKFAYKL
jgi:hypothetical protein